MSGTGKQGLLRRPAANPLAAISQHLDTLLSHQDCAKTFPQHLATLLRAVVPVDEICLLAYPPGGQPEILYRETSGTPGITLDTFVKGAYLLDPFHEAGSRGHFGFSALRDITPDGFHDSAYWSTYYQHSGITDECGFLVDADLGTVLNLSLGRRGSSLFSADELANAQQLTAVIRALLRSHLRHLRSCQSTSAQTQVTPPVASALEIFGADVLTSREQQVIQLVLQGHTSRAIAKLCGIVEQTVKLHRKHAYAKLQVPNQTALFHLFIASLDGSLTRAPDPPQTLRPHPGGYQPHPDAREPAAVS